MNNKPPELMEQEHLSKSITLLIQCWQEQGLKLTRASDEQISQVLRQNDLTLPKDFLTFYSRVNGERDLYYHSNLDENCFTFFPIEAVQLLSTRVENPELFPGRKLYVFCDYMHESWDYAVDVKDNGEYEIGTTFDGVTFHPFTNSLATFIDLYLEDSPILYE